MRSIKTRTDSATQRSAFAVEETVVEKPRRSLRVAAADLQEVSSLVRKAERLEAQGNVEEAERCYIQALTIHPDACEVQADLARLFLTTGREAKAEALYRELIGKRKDISYFSNLGLAYYRQGKFFEACESYAEALSKEPTNPERQYALGRSCIAAKRYTEAAPLLEKASARLARDTELLHLLAECYMCLGYKDQAEDAYRRINKLQPYDQEVKEKLSALANA